MKTSTVFLLLVFIGGCLGANNLPDYKNHQCLRECKVGAPPVTCTYDFTIENYFALSKACYDCPFNKTDCDRPHCVATNGVKRGIITVNRMLPGPTIVVCQNDMIVVNVHNKMEGSEGTSIHWHGVFQKGYQHHDGVSMITQCPITAHSSFQYRFKAANRGTHYWHGHAGFHRSDGLFGGLVVREPLTLDPSASLYQYDLPEHIIQVHDWLVELSINRFLGHHHSDFDSRPASMLINGRGAFQEFLQPTTNTPVYTPYTVFNVKQTKSYRFRVLSNAIFNCPIQISVDGHDIIMIASDGVPFEPAVVSSFYIYAGERYDFILNADKDIGNYWVKARGIGNCATKKAKQVAILRYDTAPEVEPTGATDYESCNREGPLLNPYNTNGDLQNLPVVSLSTTPADPLTQYKVVPDKKFYIVMDLYHKNNYKYNHADYYPVTATNKLRLAQFNDISNMMPPSPPLSQYGDIPKDMFCENQAPKNCSVEYCECIHTLKVGLGETVEIVLIDGGYKVGGNHPIHLHGHHFRVVAMEKVNTSLSEAEFKQMEKDGLVPRKLDTPIAKDTVTVPSGGYTIIRFVADNPGFWLLHCHIDYHVAIGMSALIQVGGVKDMPRPPKNFPRCGNWHYTGEEELEKEEEPQKPCPTNHCAHLSAGAITLLSILVLAPFL